MPRTAKENERIRSATREQILIAAIALFCQKGYYSTSIEDVAKGAGISKGLVYHYFKGKEELLSALVDIRINDIVVVMNAAAAKETPVQQIQHIVEGALDDVRRKPEIFLFYLNLFTQPRLEPAIAKYSQKLMDEQARQFTVQTEMFRKLGATNPQQRSLYFSATLQGIMLMFSTYPETFPLDKLQAQVIAEFCE